MIFVPIFVTILYVFFVTWLATSDRFWWLILAATSYTAYTLAIYKSYDLIAICCLVTLLSWLFVYATHQSTRWLRSTKIKEG